MAGYFPLSPQKNIWFQGKIPSIDDDWGKASHDETESPMIWGFGFGVSDSHSLRTCRAFFAKQILKKNSSAEKTRSKLSHRICVRTMVLGHMHKPTCKPYI